MVEHIGWKVNNKRRCKRCNTEMRLVRNLIGWEWQCPKCFYFESDGYG